MAFLHVLNGDAPRPSLADSGVPGDVTIWADALHVGPTLTGLSPDGWRSLRTAFWAKHIGGDQEWLLENYRDWDEGLARYARYDEVVFWLEHDLFDQLLLLRHLHWLATIGDGTNTRFTLICVGEFPGVERFTGVGMLEPQQLASLFPQRVPITDDLIAAGSEGWNLFCSTDPVGLEEWANGAGDVLPFVPGALHRHFQDFPSTSNGLSRSQSQILEQLSDGNRSPVQLFAGSAAREERVFMGDSIFWAILKDLAEAPNPLLTWNAPSTAGTVPNGVLAITAAGRDVLARRTDHVALNGIDRWMGGLRLLDGKWRWDGERLTRVR